MTTPFNRWYAKNATKLAEKRRARYNTDPEYRNKALQRSKKQRQDKVTSDGKTITFGEAAKVIGVSTVTLRSWKTKDYYPEPSRNGRHIVLSQSQLEWLVALKSMFVKHKWSMHTDAAKKELDDLVRLIYSNW